MQLAEKIFKTRRTMRTICRLPRKAYMYEKLVNITFFTKKKKQALKLTLKFRAKEKITDTNKSFVSA